MQVMKSCHVTPALRSQVFSAAGVSNPSEAPPIAIPGQQTSAISGDEDVFGTSYASIATSVGSLVVRFRWAVLPDFDLKMFQFV